MLPLTPIYPSLCLIYAVCLVFMLLLNPMYPSLCLISAVSLSLSLSLPLPSRKKAAAATGERAADDAVLPDLDGIGFASKRDRWNGFDAGQHQRVVRQYEALEAAREAARKEAGAAQDAAAAAHAQAAKDEKRAAGASAPAGSAAALLETIDAEEAEAADGFKASDASSKTQGSGSTRTKTTSKNLRIREDTAKYLLNLDPDSAFYDPKSRSMRENPNPDAAGEADFAGDNFLRQTGEVASFQREQVFAIQAAAGGADVSQQGAPSQLAALHRQYCRMRSAVTAAIAVLTRLCAPVNIALLFSCCLCFSDAGCVA